MSVEHVQVFSFKIQVSQHIATLENYSNFKNKFLFSNDSILESNDYYSNRNMGNISFVELCEMINTLSNYNFPGLDKFRLRTSLRKIKEMCVKMNKTTKSKRNESCMSSLL